MLLLTSKYKFYLYLIFFIFLSSIFNFKFLDNYQELFTLKKININGISNYEKRKIEKELNNFQNTNIFKLGKDKVLKNLNQFNYLENIYINKIIPSSINVNLSKTSIIGKTIRNGETFYIGNNRKFINFNELSDTIETASVFGNFKMEEYINLLNILKNNKLNIKNIKNYNYYKNKRWDLLFFNGLTLKLPSKKLEESIQIYNKLLDNGNLTNIKIIDLRVTNQIILTNNE